MAELLSWDHGVQRGLTAQGLVLTGHHMFKPSAQWQDSGEVSPDTIYTGSSSSSMQGEF